MLCVFGVFSDDHIIWTKTSISLKIYRQIPILLLIITKKLTRTRLEHILPCREGARTYKSQGLDHLANINF